MNYLAGKKILFICPSFFGYEHEIELGLKRMGARVDFYDERPFKTSFGKILNRIDFKFFINKKIKKYYSAILDRDELIGYDFLFVVAPETIPVDFLTALRSKNNKIKTILYLWDSIKNKNASKLIDSFDKVFTFDEADVVFSDNIEFLPLFYIDNYDKNNAVNDVAVYDFAFIGTAHSGRYNIVNKIVDGFDKEKCYLYFFSPSRMVFFLKKIFTKELHGISFNNISFKSMKSKDVIEVLARSKVVIDIEHPDQNGLTMRTIEMLGMQKKIITTNENVKRYDFYNPNNILVVDRESPNVKVDFLQSDYQSVDENIRNKYSLSTWLCNIFSSFNY